VVETARSTFLKNMIDLPDQPNLQIVGIEWRSGIATVGFVAVQEKNSGKWHAFIGPAKDGISAESDAIYIAQWGAKLSVEEAMPFFRYLPEEKYTLDELY
jgi:hypothetical protein